MTLKTHHQGAGRGSGTRDRILDAAEQLFAQQGFAATSLRQITSAASVNLAAVNYHFKSKESLILAVLMRKLGPINQRRIELLDELEAGSAGQPMLLEDVLRAFVGPVLDARRSGVELCNFPKLMGRMYTEPGDWILRVFPEAFGEVLARFRPAFQSALPGAEAAEVIWGVHFAIGSMAHYLATGPLLTFLSQGRIDPDDIEGAGERLVRFMAGGMRALAVKREVAR